MTASQSTKPVYGAFDAVEATRPDYPVQVSGDTKSPANGTWVPGSGATDNDWKKHEKVSFDPYAPDRNPLDNYKLFISAVTPRPIGFISTVSKDGVANLAPFSYFNVVNSDPITFVVGISKATGEKDTARNLKETEEATVNIISEWFIEAANFTCVGAPANVSEWSLSGLTKAPSDVVKPSLVAESAFSVECVVSQVIPMKSKYAPGRESGDLFILEGVRVHVRKDIADPNLANLDITKLKPVSRLGGFKYAPVVNTFDIPRPEFSEELAQLAQDAEKKK